MSIAEQFLIGMQAYQRVKAELRQEKAGGSTDVLDNVDPSVGSPALFPEGSLLLGFAEDSLPILLDLYNPVPGPLLVAGEGGSGKTAFLQSLARASGMTEPGDIQFAVLTSFPEEWAALETLPNSLGIYPITHPFSTDLIAQLVDWATTLSKTRQVVLLLIDGLDLLASADSPLRNDLDWLFANGPEGHVWPVVSLNPARLSRMNNLLDFFHTRIVGQVRNKRNISLLAPGADLNLADLEPGIQFGLSQPEGWLKFILPPLS